MRTRRCSNIYNYNKNKQALRLQTTAAIVTKTLTPIFLERRKGRVLVKKKTNKKTLQLLYIFIRTSLRTADLIQVLTSLVRHKPLQNSFMRLWCFKDEP